MKNNPEQVVKLLKSSKLTSYKISQDTGISDQTIQNYRKGKTEPKGVNLVILAKYLGIGDDLKDEHYIENGDQPFVADPLVTVIDCVECINKQKEIEYWKSKFYALCDESREIERKYIQLLEHNTESKKETPPESSAQAV